jgi:hypothetical protein
LNELGVSYYLTSSGQFLNLSIHLNDWYLVIVDNPWYSINSFYPEFRNYVANGGRFLMAGYQVHSNQASPLWPLLGFEYHAELLTAVPISIWTAGASIFNLLHDFSNAVYTPVLDYGDDGDYLTVFDNATALAGLVVTLTTGNATIILRNDGKTIYNGYLIDELSSDMDNSTYADNYELWLNEIAYLLKPTIDRAFDIAYTEGETRHSIVWHPNSFYPLSYVIEKDGMDVQSQPWTGGSISIDVDGLTNGTYVYRLIVTDKAGYIAVDEVDVTVAAVTPTTTGGGALPIDPMILIVVIAVVGLAVVLIIVFLRKRGK